MNDVERSEPRPPRSEPTPAQSETVPPEGPANDRETPFSQLALDELRAAAARTSDASPEREIEARWRWEALMKHLTPDERRVAELYYVGDCTMVEIARALQRSESETHLLHSRLCDKLRRLARRNDETGRATYLA